MLLVNPIYCRGAISDTAAQDDDPTPCAKKETVKIAIINSFEVTKLTSNIEDPSSVPMINGALRAADIE